MIETERSVSVQVDEEVILCFFIPYEQLYTKGMDYFAFVPVTK